MSVQAAAERLRRLYGGESYAWVYGCEQSFGGHQQRDERKLLDAYLAEHPADDAELIDEAWLRSVGFTAIRFQDDSSLKLKIGKLCDEQWIEVGPATLSHGWFNLRRYSDEMEELPADIVEVNTKTRGDLRRLLSALGIPLKGTP